MAYSHENVKKAVRDLLVAVGEDPERDGLLDTPERVAKAFTELLSGMEQDPKQHLLKQFEISHDDPVLVKDIEFYSLCEHHLLPFHGKAHICYIPEGGKVVGLSKLARLVEGYARKLQVQERMTQQIADAISEVLSPKGVLVVLEAEHLCMSMRGVGKTGTVTTTITTRGVLDDFQKKNEILDLLRYRS